ncbi:proteasome assembly chaperone family protein [Aquipuribacter nitratireducens]|uniref:Proteasome assembly chaperone family protein n=1 Tax=Aquipuribacter nitratireducens TaxID=650104 RepID=A0ABW0GKA6_9MICO
MHPARDENGLLTYADGVGEPDGVHVPEGLVLVHHLAGFVDAGSAASTAVEALLEGHRRTDVAELDADVLVDHRSRRPAMGFDTDRWTSYEAPRITVSLLERPDEPGQSLLLLHGVEPDYRWEAFTGAVVGLVRDLGVRLVVGLSAIPMGVPHTRPAGVITHGTRAELVRGRRAWVGQVRVPGHVGGLLEYRLGQSGLDAMAFTVNVPHYVAQADYPEASAVLLEHLQQVTGVALDVSALRARAVTTRADIDAEVAKSAEVAAVVQALEEQYDSLAASAADDLRNDLPDADELGAELERFLAEREPGGGAGGAAGPEGFR